MKVILYTLTLQDPVADVGELAVELPEITAANMLDAWCRATMDMSLGQFLDLRADHGLGGELADLVAVDREVAGERVVVAPLSEENLYLIAKPAE